MYGVIYVIHNTVNEKYYIGQTMQPLQARWKNHKACSKVGRCHIHQALRKYGANAFRVSVVAYAESEEQLNALESLWIILTRSYDRGVGYNLTYGGGGVKHTSDTISRMKGRAPWNKGHRMSSEFRARCSERQKGKPSGHKGKKSSEDTIALLRQAKLMNPVRFWLGKKRHPDTIAKIVRSKTGKHFPKHECPHCSSMIGREHNLRRHIQAMHGAE